MITGELNRTESSLAPLRAFAPKVEVVSANDAHVRFVPGPLARMMVDGGTAMVIAGNGRIKAIRLLQSAASHAVWIGPASGPRVGGSAFSVREKLDSGHVVWRFHARSFSFNDPA